MKAVLYLRYSSDKQTEQSIEGQQRVCEDFCRREGYEIVDKYIDRATSAFKNTKKRSEFLRMITEAENGLWDAVVVYSMDRFSRNRLDALAYKNKLNQAGVRVISATENISDKPEGVILESVLEAMAEYYSLELSQKITRGMRESALKANSTGGQLPLGYRIENKKYVVVEEEAAIVREAFDLYVTGHGIKEIIRIFNEKGYRTAKGAEFSYSSFNKMFSNEKYVGIYTYDGIRVENGMPAIISQEVFDAAQLRREANRHAPAQSKAKEPYLLSGKLFCGHCGSAMVADCTTKPNGTVYRYYTCSAHKRGGKCTKKQVSKEWLERTIVTETIKQLTPELIGWIADITVAANEEEHSADKVISAAKAEIADCESKIGNLVKAIEVSGETLSALTDRIKVLSAQKRDAEKRIAEAEKQYVKFDRDDVIWFLTQFCSGDTEDPVFCRRLINFLVKKVTLWDVPDGKKEFDVDIEYNVLDSPLLPKNEEVRISDAMDHQSGIRRTFTSGPPGLR